MRKSSKYSVIEFKKMCYDIYGNQFDFSDSEYINNRVPVTYKCNRCNNYSKNNPYNILNSPRKYSVGCRKCNLEPAQLTTEKFIELAKSVHGDRYDYSLTSYTNAKTKVIIKCNLCSKTFTQRTTAHLYNQSGCPKCKKSHGERIISLNLDNKHITYFEQYKFINCLGNGGKPLIFDFYLPNHNLCIEYDGKQHTDKKSKYWSPTLIINDNIKNRYCEDNGIKLIRISYLNKDQIPAIISEIFAMAPIPISPQNNSL